MVIFQNALWSSPTGSHRMQVGRFKAPVCLCPQSWSQFSQCSPQVAIPVSCPPANLAVLKINSSTKGLTQPPAPGQISLRSVPHHCPAWHRAPSTRNTLKVKKVAKKFAAFGNKCCMESRFYSKFGFPGKYPSSPVCHSPHKPEIPMINTNLQ